MSQSVVKDFANSTTAKLALVGAMLATPFAANAVEMGADGCLAPAELMAQLKAEGQGSVVVANRVVPETPTSLATAVFVFSTALKSGKVGKGYSFEADKPVGVPNFKFCMSGEYNKARGLDVSVAELPDGVDPNSNLAKVLNFSIKEKGFNPIFYGEKNGAITVIVGKPGQQQLNGMILLGNNDPKRKADDQGGLMGLGYSPTYVQSIASADNSRSYALNSTPKP